MSNIKRSEILANREKVISFLTNKKRKKATGALDTGDGCRCCLGHMCYALDIKRVISSTKSLTDKYKYAYGHFHDTGWAPMELVNLVGLYSKGGGVNSHKDIIIGSYTSSSLADLNDNTMITPQQIGEYLKSVIEGGEDTPWRPLSDYPVK